MTAPSKPALTCLLTALMKTEDGKWRVRWTETGVTVDFASEQQAIAFKHIVSRPTLLTPVIDLTNTYPHLWAVIGTAVALIQRSQQRYDRQNQLVIFRDGRMTETVNFKSGRCSCTTRAPTIPGKNNKPIRACPHMVAAKLLFMEATAKAKEDKENVDSASDE